jgi:rSAM/selenodomain-associated transferase 1
MSRGAKTALAVMARYPEAGKVKTRLAKSIGAQPAADLYRAFLLDLQQRFANDARPLVWMYDPPDAPFSTLVSAGVCIPQQGRDLGERMRHCFEALFGSSFDRVIMIGSDVPHVRDAAIDEAERHLDDHDVVLGPSQDGGYYLIALRQPRDLFSMVEMGTPKVLERTLEVIRSAGLDAYLLPPVFDIDEEDDLRRLRDLLTQPGAPQLPHTTRVLNEITLRQ